MIRTRMNSGEGMIPHSSVRAEPGEAPFLFVREGETEEGQPFGKLRPNGG